MTIAFIAATTTSNYATCLKSLLNTVVKSLNQGPRLSGDAAMSLSGAEKGSPEPPLPENYTVYIRQNLVCTSIYYILNALNIAQKHNSVVKRVQNICEVICSILTDHNLFLIFLTFSFFF